MTAHATVSGMVSMSECGNNNAMRSVPLRNKIIGALFIQAMILMPASVHAQESVWRSCREARTAAEKIDRCSWAIPRLQSAVLLERAYNRRGLANQELRHFDEAIQDFTALLAINPKIAGYWDNRQNVFRQMGDTRRALEDANVAMRLAPGHSFVHRSRGFLFDDLGLTNRAIDDFNVAVNIDSRDAGLRVERGRLLAKSNRIQEAIVDFSEALAIDPKRFAALLERGKAYLRQGNREAALADLSLFVRVEPGDQEGARALALLESSRNETATPPKSDREKTNLAGSGFFVSSDGHIVTNSHVIGKCSSMIMRDSSGTMRSAALLSRDTASDLALLKVSGQSFVAANLRAGVRTGEEVAAFGFPLAGILATSGNFTTGNVSALAGLHDNAALLQVSTPVQPGNSGGPLVDRAGNVVGVIVSKLDTLKVASVTDDVTQNVNFAIKTSVVMNFLDAAGVGYSTRTRQGFLPPPDVADQARGFSVWISCGK